MQSGHRNREPVCLTSQPFLFPPTFSPVDAVWCGPGGDPGAERPLGICAPGFLRRHEPSTRVMFIGTSAGLSCCHQGLCCFHGWPAGRQKQVRLVRRREMFWGRGSRSQCGDVRGREGGRQKEKECSQTQPYLPAWCSCANQSKTLLTKEPHPCPGPGDSGLVAGGSGAWGTSESYRGRAGEALPCSASERLGHLFLDFALWLKTTYL